MDYYQKEKNVEGYIKASEGFDGRFLINQLEKYLQPGSSLLELGMGEGKDSNILNENFIITASDNSAIFVALLKEKQPEFEVLELDAVSIETDQSFDAVYSNKVLIHLSRLDAKKSIKRQNELLNDGGIVLHSFWYGDEDEAYGELTSSNYNEKLLTELLAKNWEIIEMNRYKEMEEGDSIYVICRKNKKG